ncbi:MAG: hypothetical protein ABI557_03190, partial [Aureliella sp.]
MFRSATGRRSRNSVSQSNAVRFRELLSIERLEERRVLSVDMPVPVYLPREAIYDQASNEEEEESDGGEAFNLFITRIDEISGSAEAQVAAANSRLSAAGVSDAEIVRSMGSEGLFLLRTTHELEGDELNRELSRVPGYEYLQAVQGNSVTGEVTRVLKGEIKVNPLALMTRSRVEVGAFTPSTLGAGVLPPPTVVTSFAGLNANDNPYLVSPPDTILAVGPSQVIEAVNNSLRIFSKDGTVQLTQSLDDFFAPLGVPSAGDPLVAYDDMASRWYVVAIDGSSPDNLLLAVSNTSDPLDGFAEMHRVAVASPGGFADFPKIGFNADAVVLEANEFNNFVNGDPRITTIDKTSLLDKNPATFTAYNSVPAYNFRAMVPAQMHGAGPGADVIYFVQERNYVDGDFVQVVRMTDVLSNSPVFDYFDIDVSDYGYPPSAQQPFGYINTNDTSFLNADWRNGKLVASHTVGDFSDSEAHAAWYEFDAPDSGLATPFLIQEGRLDPGDGISTYYPTVAITSGGAIGLTYMQSSPVEYASMFVTGRNAGDAAGTMRDPVVVAAGEDYLDGFGRAGDYSGITVDPVDGTTFWAANEYKATDAFWSTAIAQFSLGMAVTNTLPADGQIVTTKPTQYIVDFSEPFDSAPVHIQATGFKVNGLPANAYSIVDDDTLAFTFTTNPVNAQGLQTLVLAAGTVVRQSDGDPLQAYSSTFRYDTLRMQVTSSDPANGATATLPLKKIKIRLNEAYESSS